jgi:hypothetical protein
VKLVSLEKREEGEREEEEEGGGEREEEEEESESEGKREDERKEHASVGSRGHCPGISTPASGNSFIPLVQTTAATTQAGSQRCPTGAGLAFM